MKNIYHICITAVIVCIFNANLSIAQQKAENTDSNRTILTPQPTAKPRINGALVYGARSGNPFLYRIPCQGKRPIQFSVSGLPASLTLDQNTGIISGKTPAEGKYRLTITAKNSQGKSSREFTIVSGDKLALTPPMGWNHWYAHYDRITDKMVREAADVMITSGMADVGYQYVNIDDCWMNAPANNDPMRIGPLRDEQGNIIPNKHFPDMKELTNYIHSYGLKAGIYTSPGPLTCGGFAGAFQYEEQDALQFAKWGFDFLKYDWCSYTHIANGGSADDPKIPRWGKGAPTLEGDQKPYRQMGGILKMLDRDIVFNLCQYGVSDVWKWGGEIGGHCWRTAGDLGFELDRIFDVALNNVKIRDYNKPGEWNDPDYIQIGWIGKAHKMGIPELTPMPPSMQYAYMSLWSLIAAPLIYSGDMSKLDEFTLNVLCNPEVIEVNQDPLGECGNVIHKTDKQFLLVKNLVDGSLAVGLFNKDEQPVQMETKWEELSINGKHSVRDLWRQKELGKYNDSFSATVPGKGVIMIRIYKK